MILAEVLMTYISSKEVAAQLGLSHSHVRILLRQGKIQGTKISRDWLIEAESLEYKRKRKPKQKGGESS